MLSYLSMLRTLEEEGTYWVYYSTPGTYQEIDPAKLALTVKEFDVGLIEDHYKMTPETARRFWKEYGKLVQ